VLAKSYDSIVERFVTALEASVEARERFVERRGGDARRQRPRHGPP
jgi:hypothetical protein